MSMETALPQQGTRAIIRRGLTTSAISLVLLWLIYGLDSISRQMIYMVLPAITTEFNLTPTSAGLMTTLITLSTAAICVPVMVWADKGGHGWRRKYRHLPIVIGYTLFTFLTGFNVLTASLAVLVLMQVLSHAIGGAGEAIEVASAGEWWSKQRRGMALGIHHTGYPWGTLVGGFAVSAVLAAYGPENWRVAFLYFPIPVVVVFTIYWWFANKRRYDTVVESVEAVGHAKPLEAEAVDADSIKPAQAVRNPNIGVIALIAMMSIVGYFGLSFWLPQYLAFVAHYNYAEVAAYSVLFTITGGIGQIVWGAISDRIGRKLSLMIVLGWIAVGIVLFQFADTSLGAVIGIQLFVGFALNAPYTLVYAIAFDSAGKGSTGVASSIVNVGIYLGGFSPYLVGALIALGGGFSSPTGYNIALYFLAGLMLVALIVTALFTRETVGRFRSRDRALVSLRSCNLDQATGGA
ncbi:nitrate/nitrite transporter [Saccharopolyspora sp. ASAGF58]|uniref:MFS transporter n=1 Tax=Saccharopolyspora sp. ASAGF58 TaxID=2719023 RepID=UPI00143FD561|nr:MFS transporter [Saccharopolyspora sp. ASAGF58]QIZ37719.1 MFS transporter [Saccharopolyspora sp. ASAGF58]